jgi:hypothetical protein
LAGFFAGTFLRGCLEKDKTTRKKAILRNCADTKKQQSNRKKTPVKRKIYPINRIVCLGGWRLLGLSV